MYYNFIHTRKRYAMKIVLEKDAQKHIKEKDKPTRQRIKDAIRFIEEAEPLPDEIEVMNRPVGEVTPVEQFDWGL